MCAGYDASHRERAELRRLCPVCSLQRWHRVAPDSRFVSTLPSGKPFLRDAFNRELRRALRIALGDHPLADDIVRRLAAKSFRSGACIVLVTAGTADMAAWLPGTPSGCTLRNHWPQRCAADSATGRSHHRDSPPITAGDSTSHLVALLPATWSQPAPLHLHVQL
jgi:hypothetical protein